MGMDHTAQASGPVEFHTRSLEFGKMGQLENLCGSVRRPGPQVARAALQQPLCGQIYVVHQGFRCHDGHIHSAAQFLVQVELLFVHGFL